MSKTTRKQGTSSHRSTNAPQPGARVSKAATPDESSDAVQRTDVVGGSPKHAQGELMRQLSISFEGGVYRLGDFCYDNLGDAVDYARLCLRRYIAGRSEAHDVLRLGFAGAADQAVVAVGCRARSAK